MPAGHVMSEVELDEVLDAAWSNEGFVSREHEEARLAAGRAALRRFREEQLLAGRRDPDLRGTRVQLHAGRRPGARSMGPRRRGDPGPVDRRSGAAGEGTPNGPRTPPSADVVNPTLGIMGRERVTITDYKSSDVRDPARARQRARESLQLQIYAMGYEAMTGRLPDALALHFLDSGLVGKVPVDPKRLAKARDKIATAAAGIRARDYTATPDQLACSWCAFRDICPSSVAGSTAGR